MSESIKKAKITAKKIFVGDKGADVVEGEFDRVYNNLDLIFFTAFLKVAFPDGTYNKFAMTKTVTDDKITVRRTVDAALSKCSGNLKAQIVMESIMGEYILQSAIFTLRIDDSVKDETNSYVEIPSAVTDLQHELQSQLRTLEYDIQTMEADIQSVETFMGNSFVNTVNGRSGEITLSKSDVGLSAADNTADIDKPLSTAATAALADKVDKVTGKGLSTEDYTSAEKIKLAGLNNYDDTAIVSALSAKADSATVAAALAEKANSADTAAALAGKVDKVTGKGLSTEDYTSAEKIKLAGLNNYDDTAIVSALSAKADSATVAAALAEKANVTGEYPELCVGKAKVADNLKNRVGSKVFAEFLFRPTGSGEDVGTGTAVIKKICGNSVNFNQLLKNGDFGDGSSHWYARSDVRTSVAAENGVLSHTFLENQAYTGTDAYRYGLQQDRPTVAGHKYLFKGKIKSPISANFKCEMGGGNDELFSANANEWTSFAIIITVTTAKPRIILYPYSLALSQNDSVQYKDLCLFDLTKMFGAGREPSATLFKTLYPLDYYEYSAGKIVNFKGNALYTTGFNAYDHSTGLAKVVGLKEYEISGAYSEIAFMGVNGTTQTITPDQNGRFTPAENGVLSVLGGNATDTCVHLVWSGYKNGEYEKYENHTLDLSDIYEIKDQNQVVLFPDGLRSVGDVCDEIYSDKAIKRIEKRSYQSGDESDGSVLTDGTDTYYVLLSPVTVNGLNIKLDYKVFDFGTEEIGFSGETSPFKAEINYALNAVDTLRRLPVNYIKKSSFDGFLTALISAMGDIGYDMTVSSEFNESTDEYDFTVNIAESV